MRSVRSASARRTTRAQTAPPSPARRLRRERADVFVGGTYAAFMLLVTFGKDGCGGEDLALLVEMRLFVRGN